MKISLCPVLYSQNDLLLDANPDSEFIYQQRRITRTATLDGGCYIADNGYTPSDGTIKLIINYDNYQTALATIIQQFGMVTVSSPYGLFLCAFESLPEAKDGYNVNLLIKSQLA